MNKPILNYENGEFIYPISDTMGLDPNGNLHMRMSDSMSMDMNTGEVHIVDSWKNEAGKEKKGSEEL